MNLAQTSKERPPGPDEPVVSDGDNPFAFLAMKIHLGMLVRRFRPEPVDDAHPEPEFGINLRYRDAIRLLPVGR